VHRHIEEATLIVVNEYVNIFSVRRIVFYKTESGDSPIAEFLDSLNAKDARKVTWVLRLIEEQVLVPSSYFKKLKNTDEIWEARAQSSGNAYRILGFQHGDSFVVLTNGFAKKSQKTPRAEIRLAESRRAEWLRRNT
jgi:phage-related protein